MEKLISMTDFVLHESFGVGNDIIDKDVFYSKVSKYANFLKQPLELGFFIPCDLDANFMEEPEIKSEIEWYLTSEEQQNYLLQHDLYQEAKDRVLFEGFEITNHYCNGAKFEFVGNKEVYFFSKDYPEKWELNSQFKIVESLVKYNLFLTESAKKQILGS